MWTKKYCPFVLIAIAISIFSNGVSAFVVEKEVDENELWLRLERLHEAEECAEENPERARILLEGIMEKYPDYAEAKDLYAQVRGKSAVEINEANRRRAEQAAQMWFDYQNLKKLGVLRKARDKLIAIRELYPEGDARPEFIADFGKELAEIDAKTDFLLSSAVAAIEKDLESLKDGDNDKKKLAFAVDVYGRAQKLALEYPGLQKLELLRTDIAQATEKVARVIFAKISMLIKLEGCEGVLGELKEFLDVIKFQELKFYDIAKKELGRCES